MKKLFTSSSALWSCFFAMAMMLVSQSAWAEYVKLTALRGTGGEGRAEGYQALVDTWDGRNGRNGTKWGQRTNFGNGDQAWVIVKAEKAFSPQNYYLVTANDTNGSQGRQWTGWNIYGANFESDDAAQSDAEAWVLIDQREDADVSMQNFGVTQFTLNDGESLVTYDGTPYQYYMIEVTSMKTDDQYLQMGEFGFGTYADFQTWLEVQAADPTKPVSYTGLSGDPAGFGGEGWGNLFDNNSGTKWCTWIVNREKGATEDGAYVIFKAGRPMAPSYYSLTTANDSKNSNRNWKQWQLYGMNASSDAAATRDAAGWVLLDERENIGADELPNENYAQAFFLLPEAATTSYKYYKLELDRVWGGNIGDDALMQMSELSIGDEYTLALDRNAVLESITYDPDLFAQKTLLDQLGEVVESIKACGDPKTLGSLNTQAGELQNKIVESAKQYAELTTARNMAANQLADDDVADAVLAYVTAWASETDAIAPCEDYPIGNFAYIVANRQVTGEEAVAEAKRFTTLLLNNTKKVPVPIASVGYEFICGTTDNWKASEGPASLIDGDRDNTKWGTGTGGDRWLVFKANEPIKPTYYGLVTGDDTSKYPDRNWRNWKIFAANFDEGLDPNAEGFDPSAVKNSDKWVLIDVKENVGTDVLKTTSLFESYINLSIGCAEPYSYFKIEVYQSGGMQMNEFTFYNMGDLAEYREDFVAEFVDYDPLEEPAYKGYTDAYAEKYEELQTTVNAPDVMKLRNELIDLQDVIASSVEKYADYIAIVEELQNAGAASESLEAWFDGYTGENIAPNNIYRNGTYEYIMDNLQLDNDALGRAGGFETTYEYNADGTYKDGSRKVVETLPSGEIGYIQNMVNAATDGVYVLVDGHTDGQWGDGFYGHIIDGIALNDSVYDDVTGKKELFNATKWGGNASADGDTYVIFRTLDKTNPFFYTLTTGNDTGRFPNRNWGTWYIYGGNFEGDLDATKDADGWVLIDAKENVGQDRLHPVNAQPSYFGFSTETTESYTYYKVVVTKAYSGSQIQMNELHFGTPEEFEEIKDEYQKAAEEFEYDITAEQRLIDAYEANINAIDDCANMEALFRANYELEMLRDSITTSAKAYTQYEEAVEAVKTYLKENELDESDALALLHSYLDETVEPGEDFPNGSAVYILEEHVLADSVVIDEIDFMEALKIAAVNAGFGKGADITALIVNRTFAQAGETLQDEEGNNLGRKAEGWDGYIYRTNKADDEKYYAAEFCNNLAKFDVSQTLTGLKNGFYKVTLNAAYRGNGDLMSFAYAPMAYANGVQTFIPVIREDGIQDTPDAWMGTYPDHVMYYFDENNDSIFVGYGMWGCEGAANAFSKGKYPITLVAEVTDGTLTFGVKNEYGTKGNEWTAVGNFGLVYLGSEEADAAAAIKEVADYNAARIETLTELYGADIEDVDNYPNAPGFAAVQKATLTENKGIATLEAAKTIGETMEAIAETKLAYASLYDISIKVLDKWSNYYVAYDAVEEDFYAIRGILGEGNYETAAAAAAAEADLLAKYPDYMEVVAHSENSVSVEQSDEEAFNDLAVSAGRNPSVKIGGNFYDALEEDEVIFAFEYSATEELPASRFYIGKDADDTQAFDLAIPAAAELTQIYINISKFTFGNTNDYIRWRFASGESEVEVGIRHARMITFAQMKAEGGTLLNGVKGDNNEDGEVNLADAQTILGLMARDADVSENPAADVNGDNEINLADYQTVLGLMAQQ